MINKVVQFNGGQTFSNFSENEDGSVTKKALVLVEGSHKDNKGRVHSFPEERIVQIAENSNRKFSSGVRIPVLLEHQKDVLNICGDIEAPFIVKEITEEDLPNPKAKHLLGKMGMFCDNVVIRAKDIVDKVKNNLARELSPGIDVLSNTVKELSIVAMPAIEGMSLYSMYGGNANALSFEDMEKEETDVEKVREEFDELSEKFFCIVQNILNSNEESLGGDDPYQLLENVFGEYQERLRALFEIDNGDVGEDEGVVKGVNPYSMGGGNTVAPYSLYYDNADFALGGEFLAGVGKQIGNYWGGYQKGLGMLGKSAQNIVAGRGTKSFAPVKKYFTQMTQIDPTKPAMQRTLNWGLVGKAGLAGVGTLGAGVGAYKLGQAGLRTVGIGREEPKPWYRMGF